MKMQMIQVRVGNSEAIVEHLQLCAQVIVKESRGDYLAVRETGKRNEKPHIHVFIWLDGKIQALRKRLKKALPFLNRGNYSIIPNVDDQPVLPDVQDMWKTYACKGDRRGVLPNVLFNTMLTEDEIVERHTKYWDLQDSRKRALDDDSGVVAEVVPMVEPKRVKAPSIVDQVADYLMDNYSDKVWTMGKDDRRLVFNEVMRRLGRLGKTLDATIVRRMCYGVHNIISPEVFRDDMWGQVYPEF